MRLQLVPLDSLPVEVLKRSRSSCRMRLSTSRLAGFWSRIQTPTLGVGGRHLAVKLDAELPIGGTGRRRTAAIPLPCTGSWT